MNKQKKKYLVVFCCMLALSGGVIAGAATLSPWAKVTNGLLSNSVETTFTPGWLTKSSDSEYGVKTGKYIKNSWVKLVEGSTTDYNRSADYYKPSTEWIHTKVSKTEHPLDIAYASYGWNYQ